VGVVQLCYPRAIPFLHNGFELNEKLPVNTGLNFSQTDLDVLKEEPLALFYKTGMHWTTKNHVIEFDHADVQKIKDAHTRGFSMGNDLSLTQDQQCQGARFL
jgi:hypothetical protein